MKKEMKILGIVLISVMFLSLIAGIVAAGVFDPVKDMFVKWEEGDLSVNIAKYLFLILITVVIYSVLATVNFPKQSALRWLIAIPVSFLATAYITPKEVFSMLSSYQALGLTIGIFLPFVIIFFFTVKVIEEGKSSGIFLQLIIWYVFAAFLIYRLIIGWITKEASMGANIVIAGATVACLIFATANSYIRKRITRHFIEQKGEIFKKELGRTKRGKELLYELGATEEEREKEEGVGKV